jgi:hypothetical protein
MLFGLLSASRRLDSAAYRAVCADIGTTLEASERLAGEGILLGNLPLRLALEGLSRSPHYPAISELAGRECCNFLLRDLKSPAIIKGTAFPQFAFGRAVKSAAKLLSGLDSGMSVSLLRKRNLYFAEVRGSPFALGNSTVPQCAFITGFFRHALYQSRGAEPEVEELVCAGCDSASRFCLFALPEK